MMTTPSTGLELQLIIFEDVHIEVTRYAEGWDSAGYQKAASIVRLSPKDLERMGVKGGTNLRVTAGEETIVLEGKAEIRCSEGTGWLPASLYTNSLSVYHPTVSTLPPRVLKVSISPTQEDVTSITEVFRRIEHA